MKKAVKPQRIPPDQPLLDTTPYGYGKYDSVSDTTEKAQPAAKIFYVSFIANWADPSKRPYLFLQWRPRIVVGLSRIVPTAPNQNEWNRLHAASPSCTGVQSGAVYSTTLIWCSSIRSAQRTRRRLLQEKISTFGALMKTQIPSSSL
jgi:hypothetical protein